VIGNGHAGFGRGTLEKDQKVPRQCPTSAILDPDWGHITIKMAGHPPFGAQVILNGHEYVACQAGKRHLSFTKEGNCFTHLTDTARLPTIADTLTEEQTIGRLIQICER
jgi:hypothetical protein